MKQSEFQEATPSARWLEAKTFAEVNARDVAASRPDNDTVIGELWVWFRGVSLYHQGEMAGPANDDDRKMQKHILAVLISNGEGLLGELRQHNRIAGAGVTLADVGATLEGLYDSQRASFGGMTEGRRSQILDEVFGASWGTNGYSN